MSSNVKFQDSVLNMEKDDQEFGLRFAKHLRFVFYNSGDEFLYNMVQALRYLKDDGKTVAYTTPDKYIYLNAPKGAKIGKVMDKWKFIYIHECLHQIWDTFGVEDKVRKEKGSCNHGLMNIASDCVINDFIYNYFNLEYPTTGLVTPEAIKEDFDVDYDRRKDNQYSLYIKLLPHLKKAEALPKYKKEFEEAEAPMINIKPKSGNGPQGKTNLVPTGQPYKNGHEKAIYLINRILKDQYDKFDANDGDINKVLAALNSAVSEIQKLSGKSKSYTFESLIVFEDADPNLQTFEQGFEAGIREAINSILNTVEGIQEAMSNAGKKSAPSGNINIPLPPMDQNVPDFNETEENLFLPKTLGSFNQPQGGGGSDSKGGSGSSDEDINNMDGNSAAKDAQDSADRAQDSANKAKQKADQTGNKSDKDAANKAQKAADKAQKAANKAQKAAAQGDEKGAQDAAKDARDAAGEAASAAGEDKKGKANMPDKKDLGNDPSKGGNKPKKPKPTSDDSDKSAWSNGADAGVDIENLEDFQEDLDRDEMTPERIIDTYKKKLSGKVGEFISKCKKAKSEGSGVMGFSPLGRDRKKWSTNFMSNVVNYMRSNINRMEREWRKTFARPNRRNGVVKPGQMLKKGRVEIKEGVTITMKFFVDRSGSMGNDGLRRALTAVWSVCDKIKAQYKSNKMIKGFDCMVYPFDEGIHRPLKYGEMYSSGSGNVGFDTTLRNMVKISTDSGENTMLNVILTDGQWDIPVNSSLSELRKMAGTVIFITNSEDQKQLNALEEIESKFDRFKLILADNNWTLKI